MNVHTDLYFGMVVSVCEGVHPEHYNINDYNELYVSLPPFSQ